MGAKKDLMKKAFDAKLCANTQLGCGDSSSPDAQAAAYHNAYLAIGGSEEKFQEAWTKLYASTPHRQGGGMR